jgi:hypothetical protein
VNRRREAHDGRHHVEQPDDGRHIEVSKLFVRDFANTNTKEA